MPRTITETEAHAHFSQLMTDVCNGEEVVISRGNVPVVRLTPMQPFSIQPSSVQEDDIQKRRGKAIAGIKALRKKMVIGPPITIEEIISARDEGRR